MMISGQKKTQFLPNWRTRGNCREDSAHKILKEATTVFAELLSEETTICFFKGREQTGPFQEMLLCDDSKARMIREHVRLPLFNDWQIHTVFHFLQQTIHKWGALPKCQIAIIGTPRVQFSEVVCN